MKLSVIIPVYNEKETISSLIQQVQAVAVDKEIIIVDDGSKDGTSEVLKKIASLHSPKDLKVIFMEKNSGKGSAIRRGIKEVNGDIIIIQDADLEYDPFEYPKLIEPIVEGKTSVVYGSRILGSRAKSSWSFYLGGRVLSLLANLLYNARITDEPTCYKVFKAEILKEIPLTCTGFEFCPEVTAKVRKAGYRIMEVPISYYPRKISEGKKIRLKDGLIAIWTLLKLRFLP
ncbi:MAG: glycosyltransferase family 2 protein [Candidatus Ratteibacteria bacterium]|jgi:dolichol-phosphate mannosyltransferase